MDLIIKLLNLKITKFIMTLLVIAFIASLFYKYDWYKTQFYKVKGFYYVHKGDRAYRERKYQTAVDNYKIALKYYPGHARAGCNLGNIYVSFENYREAIAAYGNALDYDPDLIGCRMDMAIILSEELAEYDHAIQEYGKIINARPFTVKIPFIFDNKTPLNRNKGLAYYNMGLAYRGKAMYMGDNSQTSIKYLKKAKESYINAEKYLKNDFNNTYNLALTNHLLGDYNSASKQYCKAINLNPSDFNAHYNFSLLLRSMHHDIEALEELEKTVLLLSEMQNKEKAIYVYGVINETKRKILNSGNYEYLKSRLAVTELNPEKIVYKNGKITADNQSEPDMNNLLKCTFIEDKEKKK